MRFVRALPNALVRLLFAVAALIAFSSAAFAQGIPAPPDPARVTDDNGVDVISGAFTVQSPRIAVGQAGAGELEYFRTYDSSIPGWRDNIGGAINAPSPTDYTVTLFGQTDRFTLAGGVFTNQSGRGSTLSVNTGTGIYTYTLEDGTVALFSNVYLSAEILQGSVAKATTVTRPSGERVTFTYFPLPTGAGVNLYRLQSLNSNLGYQLKFEYASNTLPTGTQLTKVTAINNAVDYCDPTVNGCTGLTQTWPSLTFGYSTGVETITDVLGAQWRFAISTAIGNIRMIGVRRPTSATDNLTINYNTTTGQVQSITNGVGTWAYGFSNSGGTRTLTITNPLSGQRVITSSPAANTVSSDRNEMNRTTSYQYNAAGRVTRVTEPEGNYQQVTYGARGNVSEYRRVAKAGSGLSDIVTSATFPATCSNPVTCNQPTTTTDERGNVTDYTYDAAHGGVLSVTAPAPTGGAVRPQVRYSYTSLYAWYKDSSGSVAQAPTAVVRLTALSSCATTSSCSGGADETLATTAYGTPGVANNLLPTSLSRGDGNGSLTVTTTQTFDHNGDRLTVDGPLTGTADTTRFRYDAARHTIGRIGPDPDGAGSLKHRALRTTFNLDGRPTLIERGTVNGQSDPDWAAFTTLEQRAIVYDTVGRLVRESLVASSTTFAVAQYSYDNADRLDCAAVRMNPAVFGSLPASACTHSTAGSSGPDRIVKYQYDAAAQVTTLTTAFGTALAQQTTFSYTNNGQRATLSSPTGTSTFEYDGFDRLQKLRYPFPIGGPGTSSVTDFEQFAYDPASNLTQERRRDGQTTTYTYDKLNRPTFVDRPADDITQTYDNFARLLTSSIPGNALSFTYDALNRVLSATASASTVSYQYDAASRRTRVTWPDTFYAQYDYNLTDEVVAIRENGAASGPGVLATIAYDDYGRRSTLTRGNSVATSYTHDAIERLTSLSHDIAGSSADVVFSLPSYNAAGQAQSKDVSNTTYVFAPAPLYPNSYVRNPLDQYTQIAGKVPTYDALGNLTFDGVSAFSYDANSRLVSAPGATTLTYDPLSRLHQTTVSGNSTRLLYDGANLIAEFDNSGNLQRRYIHGPERDEPLVWYEGSGTSDRRWLLRDDLGSVVATTDVSGGLLNSNTYDEYGTPAVGNQGRFQYTGQIWLGSAGVYHYKTRAYSPRLGRFLQTDFIRYNAGPNLYAYVANDPINLTDYFGLETADCTGNPGCATPISGVTVTAEHRPNPGITPPSVQPPLPPTPRLAAGTPSTNMGEVEVVAEKRRHDDDEEEDDEGITPIDFSGGGRRGRFSGCEEGFDMCRVKAEDLYDQGYVSQSQFELRACRQVATQCNRSVNRNRGHDLFIFPLASAWVMVVDGWSNVVWRGRR